MRARQWEKLVRAAHGERLPSTPVALIIDTPWIPRSLGISTVDYITVPDVWFRANLTVMNRFPDAIFLPGFWVEPGMASEPSGFGCRIQFHDDQPPSVRPIAEEVTQLDALESPNPLCDGLMPLVLSLYRNALPMVRGVGMDIKIVAARGPLALASHLLGLTGFLVGMKSEPQKTHTLLKMATRTVRQWLEAQAEVLPGVEGIMVLDDVMGFLSPEDYEEFAHPYFKDIFSMPAAVKILHNDTNSPACYPYLDDLGVNVFNFTHLQKISSVRPLVGDSVCLMGNVPPMDALVRGNAEETKRRARESLDENAGHPAFLLSAGGGVSAGTPGENIEALLEEAGKDRR
jgi:uroporphyrinogen decarboxylase